MWLFHFRIGSELQTGSKRNSEGTGHAIRSLAIMHKAKSKLGINSKTMIRKTTDAVSFMKARSLDFVEEEEWNSYYQHSPPDIIVLDINYFPIDKIREYQKKCPVVCLAPRGESKYFSNISFKDVYFNDVKKPVQAPKNKIFSGPKYAVLREEFRESRKLLNKGYIQKISKSVVISMGGIDFFNMTSAVVKSLIGLPKDYHLQIIIGPSYSHLDELRLYLNNLKCSWEIFKGPNDVSKIVGCSELGIFGSGITAYEGICLGVPCINFGHSIFHFLRSKEFENLGIGIHGGDYRKIKKFGLVNKIVSFIEDRKIITSFRNRCYQIVDGNGASRIVDLIVKEFG